MKDKIETIRNYAHDSLIYGRNNKVPMAILRGEEVLDAINKIEVYIEVLEAWKRSAQQETALSQELTDILMEVAQKVIPPPDFKE